MLETVIDELKTYDIYFYSELNDKGQELVRRVVDIVGVDSRELEEAKEEVIALERRVEVLEEQIEQHDCDDTDEEITPLIDRKNARIRELEQLLAEALTPPVKKVRKKK